MAKKGKKGFKVSNLSALRKKYDGSGSANEVLVEPDSILWIPSRILAINDQWGGGSPYGKIIEIYGEESSGKSLLATDFAYSTIALGGKVLWADGEFSFTKSWATMNGLDLEHVEILQDKAIETISDWSYEMGLYWRSQLTNNEPILLVVDSLASLDCMDNLEAAQVDAKAEMGNRAKAIDKWLRVRQRTYEQLGITVILINQLRSKIGASPFEDPDCSNFETIVPLTDGRSFKIGEIVENKIKGNVWSFDETTKTFIEKPITGWVKKESLKDGEKWIAIKTQGPGTKNGSMFGVFTEDHAIYTSRGWVNVKNLRGDDKLITHYKSKINSSLKEFLMGCFMGDCSLKYRNNKEKNSTNIVFQDNENLEYLEWKLDKLSKFYNFRKSNTARPGKYKYQSDYEVELAIYQKDIKYRDPLRCFHHSGMNPLTMALWFMDDGHISKGRGQMSISISFDRTDIDKLIEYLNDYEFYCYKGSGSKSRKPRSIKFTAQGARNLSKYIREYIPDMMQYKLLPEDKGYYKDFNPENREEVLPLEIDIISIEPAKDKYYKNLNKYDLSIEGTKNFLAGNTTNGFVVHNTTPGGKATKYYASIRIGVYGGKTLKLKYDKKEHRVGKYTSIRVKKNKVHPPKETLSKVEVYFKDNPKFPIGFNRYFGLADILLDKEVITKKGSRYYLGDKMIANGADNFAATLYEDDELRKKLVRKSGINTISKTKKLLESISENRYPVGEIEEDEE